MSAAELAAPAALSQVGRPRPPVVQTGRHPTSCSVSDQRPPSPHTDHLLNAALISLPIKMGGLGIQSYKTVAPHAYAAASEAAETLP
jgi:hypothetical protein